MFINYIILWNFMNNLGIYFKALIKFERIIHSKDLLYSHLNSIQKKLGKMTHMDFRFTVV